MKKNYFILGLILLIGTLYHISFFHLNDILKVADSFAYLQMSYFLELFSPKGLGTGWFGFLYSLPIAFINTFIGNDFLSAKIVNIILLNISAFLLWNISRKVLCQNFSYLVVALWFLSPTFLHFNIHVLSENIYIPLFLGLFLLTYNFMHTVGIVGMRSNIQSVVGIACLIGLMYLTRAEAFIYIGSIGILAVWLLFQKKISFPHFLRLGAIFFLSFFLFISPYLIHLHGITGEWGLTNKGASNLRQANLRGIEQMDDAGFEQAVAELTSDNTQLIAGFAGGMEYTKPKIEENLGDFIFQDPDAFFTRVARNQIKLFSQNIPEIFLGKAPKLYFGEDQRFTNIFFLIFSLFPIGVLMFGIYKIYREQKIFFSIAFAFFIPALLFFTLFFTLNRYFLIFLPLFLVTFIYGVQNIWIKSHDWKETLDIQEKKSGKNFFRSLSIHKEIYHHTSRRKRVLGKIFCIFILMNLCAIYLLSTLVYYNIEAPKDEYYGLKKEAGIWLKENIPPPVTIMERFPIVTYYSNTKTRYITPYAHNITDIYEYGIYNDIDILVVDSMDFQTYRPGLKQYLDITPINFVLLKEFTNTKGQKVILYSLQK